MIITDAKPQSTPLYKIISVGNLIAGSQAVGPMLTEPEAGLFLGSTRKLKGCL